MRTLMLVVFILALFCGSAFASEEGLLSFYSFSVKSKGIGESGPVVLSGEKNDKNEIISLRIEAFGKKFEIPAEELMKIPKLPFNGIQLSYEPGYPQLGGKTLYLSLHIGFNSGITKKVLLSITESGSMEIKQKK